jgi:thymidylate synthase (FAD)
MRIYLVSITKLAEGMNEFLKDRRLQWIRSQCSDAEQTVEAAGRICYMSFGASQHRRNTAEYIFNLIHQGHDSVLEHANFTVLVDGVSRALTHQLVRHRIGFAYSQLSQQYHNESDAEFVEDIARNLDPKTRKRWDGLMREARSLYRDLLSAPETNEVDISPKERLRLRRSAARLVLPNATTSTLMITGNARAWRHLLRVRGSIKGDFEMRNYCVDVLKALSEVSPSLFEDYKIARDSLGLFVNWKPRKNAKRAVRHKSAKRK